MSLRRHRVEVFRSALLILVLAAAPALADFSGPAQVLDGDTIFVQARELRLAGIDVPEWNQVCTRNGKPWHAGRDAAKAISTMIGESRLECLDLGERSYKRAVVRCYMDGRDLAEAIVGMGWAFDYPQYSQGRYAEAEAQARESKRGIWQGSCDKPWDWRRR